MSTFIRFDPLGRSASGLTRIWTVVTTTGKALGTVSWFSHWRQYAFHPDAATVFEEDCLRAIAEFCETETRTHKGES